MGEEAPRGRVLLEEEEAPPPIELEEDDDRKARPIGREISVSEDDTELKFDHAGFEFDGNIYEVGDAVLLSPEEECGRPLVVLIKEISKIPPEDLMIKCQRLYRPEEARKKGCVDCLAVDNRELFYSFDFDEVPAETVMHRCIIHFLSPKRQLPDRTVHPGFVVQRFYDSNSKMLRKITDECLTEDNQREIHRLIEKTEAQLALLPDQDNEQEENLSEVHKNVHEAVAPVDDNVKKKSFKKCEKKSIGKFSSLIKKFQASTGDFYRDKWLVKLLQGFHINCRLDSEGEKYEEKRTSTYRKDSISVIVREKDTISSNGSEHIIWPDDAVRAATALEMAAHVALCSDFRKYNCKLGLLDFNLKKNVPLAKRLLKRELDPSALVRMSRSELKDVILACKKKKPKPKESNNSKNYKQPKQTIPRKSTHKSKQSTPTKVTPKPKQSTPSKITHQTTRETRCFGCSEKRVCLVYAQDGDRSRRRRQLQCTSCGRTWGASADEDLQGTKAAK
ncbi:ASI1-immunoprecipitated protein 3-like [Wolffia australiana]